MVNQRHLHIGTEHPTSNRLMQLPRPLAKIGKETLSQRRIGGPGKTWPHPLFGVGRQGKLGYQQQPTLYIPQAQVHSAHLIAEYSISQQTFEQAIGLSVIVTLLNPDQNHQTLPDPGNLLTTDLNTRLTDPL
jgi:hypothetical protein